LFSDPHKTHKYTVWAERRIIYEDFGEEDNKHWYLKKMEIIS